MRSRPDPVRGGFSHLEVCDDFVEGKLSMLTSRSTYAGRDHRSGSPSAAVNRVAMPERFDSFHVPLTEKLR